MKILISEEQLRVIVEAYDEQRINYLLDKINALGIKSLSNTEKEQLDKLSKGMDVDDTENIEKDTPYKDNHPDDFDDVMDPRDDEDSYTSDPFDKPISPEFMDRSDYSSEEEVGSDVNLLDMFMYFNPEVNEIVVNDVSWYVETLDGDNNPHLHVASEITDFYVTPFWEGENMITVEDNDGTSSKFKINNVPKNEKEMKFFINSFYRHILPKIIKTKIKDEI